ncbi:hypothetical protein HNQ08_005278 [Deinococcus humi]|uniref:Uncharacterized protein n=1 Tax=Deinococcus humi TaxID=662880 RepID=A0A7W8NG47_9DEIO|nr:hypothetical protein [Deinococcus humi]GGO40301.1 hypothetical protein GCM10008949_49680 [Deinococcus humi]
MLRIYVDFNMIDEAGNIHINTYYHRSSASKSDLLSQLFEGREAIFYDEEIEIDVLLKNDGDLWYGVPTSEVRDL